MAHQDITAPIGNTGRPHTVVVIATCLGITTN
jgi:hypothetical protein